MTLPLRMLHHLSLQVADVDRSLAFYRDVLGFQPIPRPTLRFPGAWLQWGVVQLHLIGGQGFSGTSAEEIRSTDDHWAFHAEDLDAVEARLKELAIPYRVNRQTSTNLKQLFFHDPDGRTIEVATYPASLLPEAFA